MSSIRVTSAEHEVTHTFALSSHLDSKLTTAIFKDTRINRIVIDRMPALKTLTIENKGCLIAIRDCGRLKEVKIRGTVNMIHMKGRNWVIDCLNI